MYQPSTVLFWKEVWDVDFSWNRIFVPGGAKGAKFKNPWIASYTDKLGFVWD